MKFLAGKKTYIVAAGGVLTAIGGFLAGTLTADAAITLAINSVMGAAIRHGISNNSTQEPTK